MLYFDFRIIIFINILPRIQNLNQVDLVINYDLPLKDPHKKDLDFKTYLNRLGKLAKTGLVINLVANYFQDMEQLRKLESHFKKPIAKLDTDKLEETMK